MKKLNIIYCIVLIVIMIAMLFYFSTTANAFTWEELATHNTQLLTEQETAHAMAECARKLGYSDDHIIIVEAKKVWHHNQTIIENNILLMATLKTYTDEDLYLLAKIIYAEARGGSDYHQQMVGTVVLNRVASNRFSGNTVKEVIYAKGQYSPVGTTRWNNGKLEPDERAYDNARILLDGYRACPEYVVYQAMFEQGRGVYEVVEGEYFCY